MKRFDLLKTQLSHVRMFFIIFQHKTGNDTFSHVPKAPLDPILGLNTLFAQDSDKQKTNLGVGAYRTEEGKPYVFEVIQKAETTLHAQLLRGKINKEYQGSDGNAQFCDYSKRVVFGEEYSNVSKRTATTQAVGGTGALRIAADFLKIFRPGTVYLPKPTWGNHNTIFQRSGLEIGDYPYWCKKARGLDLDGMLDKLNNIPDQSIVLLHSCAHNPTGVDPTPDQWVKIAQVMKKKKHFPFFDNAYQGFASGDLDKDAFSIRHFIREGFEMIVTQSYSKTMGLYGERAGAFHLVADNENTAQNVLSQLKIVIRVNYSNPPVHPMKLVKEILTNPTLYSEWKDELKIVAGRIIKMRSLLRSELERIGASGDWSNITSQIGMFSYTGLTENQSDRMVKKYHVYMLKNGRISMAGINSKNVAYVAECMKKTIEEGQ